ncbi:MAG: RpiB/LacA/LacB family sugar-phosphate isomerase [Sedimentisphaerales bacterium]
MNMAVGSDSISHITNAIISYIEEKGITIFRFGALAGRSADYVDSAHEVAKAVVSGQCDQGLLFCNTGTGASIIANKIPDVRAALCVEPYAAKIARLANNANVIVLSIRYTGEMLAKEIIDTWLATEPSTEPRRVNFHNKTNEVDSLYRKI